MKNSNHWTKDRQLRAELIAQIGEGKVVKEVIIDKHHPAGAELHILSDTGIITIENARTHKMVTKLIARPGQLKRFFPNGNIPQALINITRQHQKLAYNYA